MRPRPSRARSRLRRRWPRINHRRTATPPHTHTPAAHRLDSLLPFASSRARAIASRYRRPTTRDDPLSGRREMLPARILNRGLPLACLPSPGNPSIDPRVQEPPRYGRSGIAFAGEKCRAKAHSNVRASLENPTGRNLRSAEARRPNRLHSRGTHRLRREDRRFLEARDRTGRMMSMRQDRSRISAQTGKTGKADPRSTS